MTADTMTDDTDTNEKQISVDIDVYRRLVQNYIGMRRYRTALFWAEKVAVLNQFEIKDLYCLAQCMFLLKEYHRAASLIRFYGYEKSDVMCLYLLVECLYEAKEYQEALDLLTSIEIEDLQISTVDAENTVVHLSFNETNKNEVMASICFIKGKILEAMDNRNLAMDAYVQALQKSVHCYEALEALIQHEMLMAWEEKVLIEKLPFAQQCNEGELTVIKTLYESKLKKYSDSVVPQTNAELTPIAKRLSSSLVNELTEKMKNSRNVEMKSNNTKNPKCFTPVQINTMTPSNKLLNELKSTPTYSIHTSLSKISMNESRMQDSSTATKRAPHDIDGRSVMKLYDCMSRLENSVDLMAAKAEKMFYNGEYKTALKLIDAILKRDIYHTKSLTVKIECLVELRETTSLFYLAHRLIDLYPDEAISWYAVGCYYCLIGKSDQARRYLSKATTLDKLFGPAWLAYGHSFAKENEHDQAISAYFKGTQLMRGCHLPLLYIGVECGLTKNLDMAEKFFYQAMNIAPLDVFVLFELGVIKFEYEMYENAEEIFKTTLDMVTDMANANGESISPRWEPLFNNLGHSCRKNKKYSEALDFHRRALALKPLSAPTYTAIGFVQALMGNLEEAVESFHKSLSLKRDDVVTTTILKQVIDDLVDSDNFIEGLNYDDLSQKDVTADNLRAFKLLNYDESPPLPQTTPETGNQMNCMRLQFEDDSTNTTPQIDSESVDNSYNMSIDY